MGITFGGQFFGNKTFSYMPLFEVPVSSKFLFSYLILYIVMMTSKRRAILLIFVSKCISKCFLLRIYYLVYQIKTCLAGCLELISVLLENVPVDTSQPPGLIY